MAQDKPLKNSTSSFLGGRTDDMCSHVQSPSTANIGSRGRRALFGGGGAAVEEAREHVVVDLAGQLFRVQHAPRRLLRRLRRLQHVLWARLRSAAVTRRLGASLATRGCVGVLPCHTQYSSLGRCLSSSSSIQLMLANTVTCLPPHEQVLFTPQSYSCSWDSPGTVPLAMLSVRLGAFGVACCTKTVNLPKTVGFGTLTLVLLPSGRPLPRLRGCPSPPSCPEPCPLASSLAMSICAGHASPHETALSTTNSQAARVPGPRLLIWTGHAA